MIYRAEMRGFDLNKIEQILEQGREKYYDTATGRYVAVGSQETRLMLIPFEQEGACLTPVTVHATTRQQIRLRVKTGRFTYE